MNWKENTQSRDISIVLELAASLGEGWYTVSLAQCSDVMTRKQDFVEGLSDLHLS